MSRRHSTQSHRVHDLVKQVQETDPQDWETIFDISLNEDGTIWDHLEYKQFDSLPDWAEFNVQMEEEEEDDDRNYGYRYVDE